MERQEATTANREFRPDSAGTGDGRRETGKRSFGILMPVDLF
jgi:hypothetical protein